MKLKNLLFDALTLLMIFLVVVDLLVIFLFDVENNYWWGMLLNGFFWIIAIYIFPKEGG